MKVIKIIILILLIAGCYSDKSKNINGKWIMFQVIREGRDITPEHNPEKDRYIIINEDGTFESGGKPFGKNTGKYTFNNTDHKLFLDSDLGPEDDSNWIVTINKDTMHWQGYGTEWADEFELIHIKAK